VIVPHSWMLNPLVQVPLLTVVLTHSRPGSGGILSGKTENIRRAKAIGELP
jgi:hypothetical protein